MPYRSAQATIIGDSDAPPLTCQAAENIGAMLAKHRIAVVTGGRLGVMEAACRGARRGGGIAIGILPGDEPSEANQWCSLVFPTGIGHGRNILTVLAGDLVISLGGAAGTLSELCFAWIHNKPILTLRGHGGWSEKAAVTGLDHRRTENITVCEDLDHLERETLNICRNLKLDVG